MNKHLTEKKNIRRAARAFHKACLTDLLNVKRNALIFTGEPEPVKSFQRTVRTARCIQAYHRKHGRKYRRELEEEVKRI